ncbi:hypothetical protein LIER_10258 [Lithospermum erythrorhizon]|uniref:Uncharacterized protein n=1 Tax=Lithospermum erythrorhizon TaxID=34254 RepID=A0AAV3PJW2_LITER
MDDAPSVIGTGEVATENIGEGLVPVIDDTGDEAADLPNEKTKPTVPTGVEAILIDVEIEIPENDGKKKYKKRKQKPGARKNGANVGEASEPKKKLNKDERATKKARKAAKKAADEKAGDEDVQEEAEEHVIEESCPPILDQRPLTIRNQ